MFPFVRTRRFAVLAIAVAGVGVFGGIALLAAHVFIDNGVGKGDPDPQGDSIIAVCSDVPFHVRYIVNVGTETRPDDRKVSEEARMPNGHTVPRSTGTGVARGSVRPSDLGWTSGCQAQTAGSRSQRPHRPIVSIVWSSALPKTPTVASPKPRNRSLRLRHHNPRNTA